MIEIFTMAYNEEKMIGFFIGWYRKRFPGCKITVYDNDSTDRTRPIAESLGAVVIPYQTNGLMCERRLRTFKNNCWKTAGTSWVFVGDVDELVEIDEWDLVRETSTGATFIRNEHWEMVGGRKSVNPEQMTRGRRYKGHPAKMAIFRRDRVMQTNYEIGAHYCNPIGELTPSAKVYRFLHYKWLGLDYIIKRHREFNDRQSPESILYNWGVHYRYSRLRLWWNWRRLRRKSQKLN